MSEAGREHALTIVNALRNAGYQALFAGGCVRDMLLGHEPSDYDVATDATPEGVMGLFKRTLPVGASFGVVRVLGPRGIGEVEVATFRSDGEYKDGRRPESVTYGNSRDDAIRRDFTINGMFFDPITGEVIDYVGGRDDLSRGVIRAIGDPFARFGEDKLRLLRAIRFASRFDFAIDPATWDAILAMAPDVMQVSVERIAQEWRKMVVDRHRVIAMDYARRAGLIRAIFPEIEAIAEDSICSQKWGPGTNWQLTLDVLRELPLDPSFSLALAGLLVRLDSPNIADCVSRRLKLSTAEREDIVWLLAHSDPAIWLEFDSLAARKRILSEPGIGELLNFHRAISLATLSDDRVVQRVEEYLREEPEGPINPPPLISGRDLIQAGLKPGPAFAMMLDQVRDAQLNGEITSKDDAITFALARS